MGDRRVDVGDTTVSALARHLGVDWHTCWSAVEVEAIRRLADPARLDGVKVLGVDEHLWRPSRVGDANRAVTGMVDLTRDADRQLPARLNDVVPGRTGTAYAGWLNKQSNTFTTGIKHACLDPFRGYANAIRDELPDAVRPRRLSRRQARHPGRRRREATRPAGHPVAARTPRRPPVQDPRAPAPWPEHLSDKQIGKLNTCLVAGDPAWEVTLAWHAYQQLRSMYQAETPAAGKAIRRRPSAPSMTARSPRSPGWGGP